MSRNVITNIRSFPHLDFELSFLPARKTGDSAMLSNQRFKIKTAIQIAIAYKFKSQT